MLLTEQGIIERMKCVESMPGYSGMLVCYRLYEQAATADASGANVEIGCLFGKTSASICMGLQDRGSGDRLTIIDPFEAWPGEEPLRVYLEAFAPLTPQERFFQTMQECETPNFDLIVAKSQDPAARSRVRGPVRFAFIDGDHREAAVRADTEWLLPLMEPGGVMAFDDYGANRHAWAVAKVVDELVRPVATELYPDDTAQNCRFFRIDRRPS